MQERLGAKAANVMSNLITLGHTRIQDLRDAYFPPPDKDDGNESDDARVNGNAKWKKDTSGSLFVNGGEGANGASTNGDVETNGTNGVTKGKKRAHPDDEAEEDQERQADGDNGTIKSVAELDSIIYNLMLSGWIMRVEWTQYLGPGDLHDKMRHEAIEYVNEGRPPTGLKEKEKVAAAIRERKREMRDEWLKVARPMMRKATAADAEFTRSNKRAKLAGGNEWSARQDEILVLDEDLIIRVNPEKVTVAMRSDILVRLVRQLLGYVPAKIYECMLRQLEKNMPRCYDEWADPPLKVDPAVESNREPDPHLLVTAREVAKNLDPDIDVFDGLDPNAIVYMAHTNSRVTNEATIDPPLDPFKISLDEKTKVVDNHIKALSDHPFHFVTWHSRAGYSQWHIEFETIAEAFIQHEIENTIAAGTDRDKKYGVKLIRALGKKGKLDERLLGTAMMMPASEIRSVVNGLTLRGYVQTQEIPKVERRESKHSIHLIWYDRQRAREKLLHNTYKGMLRTMQRLVYEKEKVQTLLAKAERTDVAGNEEKWLSEGELEALKKYRGVQGKLLLQVFRMDELVAVLRDFMGPMISV